MRIQSHFNHVIIDYMFTDDSNTLYGGQSYNKINCLLLKSHVNHLIIVGLYCVFFSYFLKYLACTIKIWVRCVKYATSLHITLQGITLMNVIHYYLAIGKIFGL